MALYYVNINTHEVHVRGCEWLPKQENRLSLGDFLTCHGAVREAKKRNYLKADGCGHCSEECHTG